MTPHRASDGARSPPPPALMSLCPPRGRRAYAGAALSLGAALALGAAAPAPAAAQRVAATCEARDLVGCTTLRLDLTADDAAPWALTRLTAAFGAGWTAGDGAQVPFTAEDAFAFGTPIAGVGSAAGGTAVFDFLASPGFAFELTPGATGWLRFAVRGVGLPTLAVSAVDPDGVATGGPVAVAAPVATVPEPSTALLLAAGALALGAARRRAPRPA